MNPRLTNAAANLKRRARKAAKARARGLPAIWLMSDAQRLPDPATAVALLPRGAGLILRHYEGADRAVLAKRLSILCRRRGVVLVIAGDWRLAASVGAAGLHLAEHMARPGPPPGARLWLRNFHKHRGAKFLTVAAHGGAGLRRARARQASAAILAPVFVTASHPGRHPLGALRTAALVRETSLPVLALGGITAATIGRLRASGCVGMAGISFAVSQL